MFALPGPSYQYAAAVTPTDTPADTGDIKRAVAIFVGTGGDLTITQNIAVGQSGVAPTALTSVLISDVPSGFMLTCCASWTNINATGTTASGIVAFYTA